MRNKIIYSTDCKANTIDQELNKNVKLITDQFGWFGEMEADFIDHMLMLK